MYVSVPTQHMLAVQIWMISMMDVNVTINLCRIIPFKENTMTERTLYICTTEEAAAIVAKLSRLGYQSIGRGHRLVARGVESELMLDLGVLLSVYHRDDAPLANAALDWL